MQLADIQGGKVIIHPDLLIIPPFKKLWESSNEKGHVQDVISYIVFNNRWDSPYVLTIFDDNERSEKLKEKIFGNKDYTLTPDEKACEQEFINFQHTDLLQMLQNMRKKLNSFSKWYGDSLDEDLDEKIIDKYLAGFGKVKDAYITLDYLEKAIKAGEINNSKVRGDAKVNPYELVR